MGAGRRGKREVGHGSGGAVSHGSDGPGSGGVGSHLSGGSGSQGSGGVGGSMEGLRPTVYVDEVVPVGATLRMECESEKVIIWQRHPDDKKR